jgi:hypothetical protein
MNKNNILIDNKFIKLNICNNLSDSQILKIFKNYQKDE